MLGAPADVRPTGYFVASLMSAIGALSELTARGVGVPADASLVAFNDHPFAAHTAPPLTTVRMPNVRMGEQAVGMLLAAMEGEPVRDVVIDDAPELVIRASTSGPAPSRGLTAGLADRLTRRHGARRPRAPASPAASRARTPPR